MNLFYYDNTILFTMIIILHSLEKIALVSDSCNIDLARAIFSCIILNANQYYPLIGETVEYNTHAGLDISLTSTTMT